MVNVSAFIISSTDEECGRVGGPASAVPRRLYSDVGTQSVSSIDGFSPPFLFASQKLIPTHIILPRNAGRGRGGAFFAKGGSGIRE